MARIRGRKNTSDIQQYIIDTWGGLNTSTKNPREIPAGYASDAKNWLTGWDPIKKKADRIELRRGSARLCQTDLGSGKVTGLGVGSKQDGTEVPFFSYARKVNYYNSATDDVTEVGSDLLPAVANGEDVDFANYANLAGNFVYLSSQNSSVYKIPVANPANAVDQSMASYRGRFTIYQSRMLLWQNGSDTGIKDNTSLFQSYLDRKLYSSYTADGLSRMSLPQQPTGVASLTGGNMSAGTYYYVITAICINGAESTQSTESAGIVIGSGTTGSVTLTLGRVAGATSYKIFRTTSSGSYGATSLIAEGVTSATYVDTLASPTTGTPAGTTTQSLIGTLGTGDGSTTAFSGTFTSVASDGTWFNVSITDGTEFFYDDKNGVLIGNLGGTGTINYATGAWAVTFNTAPASGKPITGSFIVDRAPSKGILDFSYNSSSRVGFTGNFYPQYDTSGALHYVGAYNGKAFQFHKKSTWSLLQSSDDLTNTNNPFRETMGVPYRRAAYAHSDGITFLDNSDPAHPRVKKLYVPATSTSEIPKELSEMLDLSTYTCTSAVVYRWGDYDIVCLQSSSATYNDTMFVRNVNSDYWDKLDYRVTCLEDFDGVLLGGDSISNNVFKLFSGYDDDAEVIINNWDSGDLDLGQTGQKKVKRMVVEGLIQPSQELDINLSYDGANPVTVFTVSGTGSYVASSSPQTIGAVTLGSKQIGDGGSIIAYPYRIDFLLASDKFEYVKMQFVAQNIGYVSVNRVTFKDIRNKGNHLIPSQTSG